MSEPIEEPAVPPPNPPHQAPRPWWSRALLGVSVLGISLLALYHLSITFLTNSPTNTVSTKFATPISKWVYPWFEQNWRLFAPNPMSQNFTVEARVSTDCYTDVTPWYNLSQMDYDTIAHNVFPGHTEQNELRRAWTDGYAATHDSADVGTSGRADMMRQYLVNIALQRIDPLSAKDGVPSAKIMNIEFRVTTTDIAPAEKPNEVMQPVVHIIPWRQVSPDAVSYGCPNGSVAP
ncbi:conserved hypothetical protein [Catenulispora acidiphila DSM 44928]|uniref:Uncharacterized protein n=1 Tax=Catenulispora acidiphila (strain DSM 44928 / JCM 14897 / NBRC 102108 / NRRL B-24433 / ID139908) TaxID=479433 RepID=C7QA09_CATAD|nr:DUF5819 family protein [Catenulispora acidiphila]ACU70407.1 conserved hypothetical protein [Catenulispora acidiphila DSM 44928]